ncbi:T6SS immunity protein Tdi1 domain-containing protein [Parasegetibacter sp. NRK P23]|uniref:T6SS immunity protein Tdi1 domain-containing protein n=1 Tax=Parasegetibacter sp. NRK P23 TaxID=2942999 RepID=UPI00204470A2|nr:T6SS immunity protein Tdi1 domain-containing protein [Parasegetibacter sp. NRK P23]MCM5530643.1 DUF1851 domain-containing protein [Parasegetibacter sp. NRK P23]
MRLSLAQLTKDIANANLEDFLSCWRWLVTDMKAVVTISCLGDMFFLGKDDNVYWLQTENGELTKIASSLEEYQLFLDDEVKLDDWFLPLLIEKLIDSGKTLKENEVYSYKQLPILGGEYSVDNIDPTDMSIHFAFCGQICEQIKNLPDGTKVNIKVQ